MHCYRMNVSIDYTFHGKSLVFTKKLSQTLLGYLLTHLVQSLHLLSIKKVLKILHHSLPLFSLKFKMVGGLNEDKGFFVYVNWKRHEGRGE